MPSSDAGCITYEANLEAPKDMGLLGRGTSLWEQYAGQDVHRHATVFCAHSRYSERDHCKRVVWWNRNVHWWKLALLLIVSLAGFVLFLLVSGSSNTLSSLSAS